jgi:hypothetical protein
MPKYTLTKLPKARLNPDTGFGEDQILVSWPFGQQIPTETCRDPGQKNFDHGEGICCSGHEAGPCQHLSHTFGQEEVVPQTPNTQALEVLPKDPGMTLEPITGTKLTEDIPKIRDQASGPPASPTDRPDARPAVSPEILDTDSEKSKIVRFFPPIPQRPNPDWLTIDYPSRRFWIS